MTKYSRFGYREIDIFVQSIRVTEFISHHPEFAKFVNSMLTNYQKNKEIELSNYNYLLGQFVSLGLDFTKDQNYNSVMAKKIYGQSPTTIRSLFDESKRSIAKTKYQKSYLHLLTTNKDALCVSMVFGCVSFVLLFTAFNLNPTSSNARNSNSNTTELLSGIE